MSENAETFWSVFPKSLRRHPPNVLFCPQAKDIQFTVTEQEGNQKIFTFKKLESENLVTWVWLSAVKLSHFYLSASQRPVAPPGERLRPVVGGVDDDAVPVVSVLSQGVGDVSDSLVHRGHHGGELPPGDVHHVSVRVDVGLGSL